MQLKPGVLYGFHYNSPSMPDELLRFDETRHDRYEPKINRVPIPDERCGRRRTTLGEASPPIRTLILNPSQLSAALMLKSRAWLICKRR
jgi:hypothetical protein